jgi:ribosomal protein S18 acetylase RimI-like enzyme
MAVDGYAGPMTDTSIRIATADDIPAIAALTRLAYAKWVPVIGREPLPMKTDYAQAFAVHRFDLRFEDAALVGLIETVPQERLLLIENVAVDPSAQHRGHGRALMAHAERLAAEAGLDGTRLYTNARFTDNLTLYAALGYAVEREETLNGGVAVHMVKRRSAII